MLESPLSSRNLFPNACQTHRGCGKAHRDLQIHQHCSRRGVGSERNYTDLVCFSSDPDSAVSSLFGVWLSSLWRRCQTRCLSDALAPPLEQLRSRLVSVGGGLASTRHRCVSKRAELGWHQQLLSQHSCCWEQCWK